MIRIYKTTTIPAILATEGLAKRNALNVAYTNNPHHYISAPGVKIKSLTPMDFDNGVYGDSTVKDQLIADQHEKCCFCESKLLETSYGDVEHFRPKRAYQKLNSKKLNYPGYYWLAYDWDNLMFSCEKCNRSYKRNQFPLLTEGTRKLHHNHSNLLEKEDNLLINPNVENPGEFITFLEETPHPINGSVRGAKTIEVFKLERMNITRLEHLKTLRLALTWARIDLTKEEEIELAMETFKFPRDEVIGLVNEGVKLYNSAAKDSAKFALCVRCKFPHLPII
jgi:uncharacterized protein (TIGR02646 family)